MPVGGPAPGDTRRALEETLLGITYDRRGDVIFYDDFRSGIERWGGGGGGAAGVIDLSLAAGINLGTLTGADYVCRMTADAAGDPVDLFKHLTFFPSTRIGIEVWFAATVVQPGLFLANLSQRDGATFRQAQLRLNLTTHNLEALTPPGVYVTVAALPAFNLASYHVLKFVMDTGAGVYSRIILDGVAQPVGQAFMTTPSINTPELFVEVEQSGTANLPVYIAKVIVTQNEPEN